MNRPMTEICITKAYSTQMMLGGMIGPMIAEAAMTEQAEGRV